MKVPLIDLHAQFQTIEDEIRAAINSVLDRQKFILDEEVSGLEQEIAALTGTRFAVGCASGTDALLLSLLAAGVEPGDEVITTAYSFFATAGMISWLDAKPVFVDIDPVTFNMRTDQIRSKITPRTKSIIAVHLFGQCCEMESILSHGLPVIEDAAQAIGSSRNGKQAGSTGFTGCFSFFPTKNLGGYGDGGMIVTNDESTAQKIKSLRAHGQEGHRYHHQFIGTNSRLDEMQAAVLRVKLQHLEKWNSMRTQNATYYSEHLRHLPLRLPTIQKNNTGNFHQYVIQCAPRDALKDFLAQREIGTAIYYPIILPLQPCFSYLGSRKGDFPDAEKCAETSLALPIFAELKTEQLQFVVESISSFFQ